MGIVPRAGNALTRDYPLCRAISTLFEEKTMPVDRGDSLLHNAP